MHNPLEDRSGGRTSLVWSSFSEALLNQRYTMVTALYFRKISGVMITCSFALLRFTNSVNSNSSLLPLNFVCSFLGLEEIIFGGMVSFGPPVGVLWRAQAAAKSIAISVGRMNFNFIRDVRCR